MLTDSSAVVSNKYDESIALNSPSGSVEAEMVIKYIWEAGMQGVNATDVDIRYKKLLDAVIKTVIEEFDGLSEDKHWYDTLISKKFHLVTLACLPGVVVVFIRLFFHSSENNSFYGPLPTWIYVIRMADMEVIAVVS